MEMTLGELAQRLGAEVRGDSHLRISGVAALEDATETDISFVVAPKYRRLAKQTAAGALIVPPGMEDLERPLLVSPNPYLAFAQALALFNERPRAALGVSPKAHLDDGVRLGEGVSIQPLAYVGEGVIIGDRVTLHGGAYVGAGVEIGDDTFIHPNVTILDHCIIGKRVIIHSGTVVGSDGFGFAQDGGRHVKIPQTGIVRIDDDVEIGANCAIDRATLGMTWIQRGAKIDNLVQVAHNVVVGEDSVIVAQVGISGSTRIGKGVVLAGQVGVVGHLDIGDGVRVGAQAGVTKSIPAGQEVLGSPAVAYREFVRTSGMISRLPDLRKKVMDLEKRLEQLEQKKDA
ncbi:MAG: UDP-3-O-(3-hydroxymyristoyl)glucosamine N-acyltransferase [Nitrospirota bacterium]